jgi:hypothetical protein
MRAVREAFLLFDDRCGKGKAGRYAAVAATGPGEVLIQFERGLYL